MVIHHHFSLVTALSCSPRVAVLSWASLPAVPMLSSVTRSRVNLNWRKMVRAVKMATASMVMNQSPWFSFKAKDTSMGNTMEPTPMTPRPATLVKEARVARCLLSRVDTGIRVELAVL